jgi:hypothetical protein
MTAQIEVDAERLKLLVAYCRDHLGWTVPGLVDTWISCPN